MRFAPVLPLLLCLAAVGCKSEPSLVGKWTSTSNNQTVNMEFKSDHTAEMTVNSMVGKVILHSKWELEGEKFTTTVVDVEMSGIPSQYAALAKKQIESVKGKSETGTLKFTSNDDAQVTGNGKTQVIKRVK